MKVVRVFENGPQMQVTAARMAPQDEGSDLLRDPSHHLRSRCVRVDQRQVQA